MSIYVSRLWVGRTAWSDAAPGRVVAHPDNDLKRIKRTWPGGYVATAHIPHWCAPGHDYDDDCEEGAVAPWLRLSLGSAGADVTVLIDRAAAESLLDDLSKWLDSEFTEGEGPR